MSKAYSIFSDTDNNGRRVTLLFLLFIVAICLFASIGFTGFALVCLSPLLVIFTILAFKHKMGTFWTLFICNYFVMFANRHGFMPIPPSGVNEILEIVLLAIAIIDVKILNSDRLNNVMLWLLLLWCAFCTLEVFNNTSGLDFNIDIWYTGSRLMAFQLLYAFFVCIIFINKPKHIVRFLFLWGFCIFFATFWVWKQRNLGFTKSETEFLLVPGNPHNLSTGIRYFSTFTDAANFGCHMAAAAVTFFILAITTRIKKHRIFFLVVGLASMWSMFTSGTRTAIFCFILGGMLYIVLSKSFKIAIPFTVVGLLFVSFLAFTKIGQGNQMIRRMRSAFNTNDASKNVRSINQIAIRKYLAEAPWGIGIGMNSDNIPPGNKYKTVAGIAPDSEYVFIWVHTGVIGITTFLILTAIMLTGACWTTMFRIKNPSLRGVGAGFCCAFAAIQLGGYGNQILMQFPNVLIFYGGLAVTYTLPLMEQEWNRYEEKLVAEQEEKKRLKLEKKRASRV